MNRALQRVETEYVYFQEDDYVLMRDLDLRLGVALLEAKAHLGLVRYDGMAGERAVLHVFEAEISAALADYREGMALPGRVTYLQLDGGSPTPYLYSNRPHLKRRSFHAFYGLYDEGRKLGATEEAFAVRVKTMMRERPADAPGIAVLPDFIASQFDHIGRSYQHTEADR